MNQILVHFIAYISLPLGAPPAINCPGATLSEIAEEIATYSTLPTNQFDAKVPILVDFISNTKSMALLQRALDTLLIRTGENSVNQVGELIRENLIGCNSPSRSKGHTIIEAFVTLDPNLWSVPIRSHPMIRNLLLEIATKKDFRLDTRIRLYAIRALLLLPSTIDEQKSWLKSILLSRSAAISQHAGRLLVPIATATEIESLREVLDMNNPNREVIEFLGDYGDTESLAKLEALRSAAENNNRRSDLHLISKAITRINSQHPSTALLEFIKQCSDPVEFHWALRRAKQHGLSHAQIRLAALEYRATLSPYQQRGMTDYAISQQIMTANDIGNLPSLPDSHVHDDVEFRTPSTAQLVGRPKTSPWRPNEANNEALGQWMTTIDWDNISEEQGRQLINQKLCELDLIPPDQCAALPTSQTTAPSPTSQPGPFPP